MRYPDIKESLSIEKVFELDPERITVNGFNPDIDMNSIPEDLRNLGGLFVPPTSESTHELTSSVASDTGVMLSQGIATSGSDKELIDDNANFNGVSVGDIVLNDTLTRYSVVTKVSTTILGLSEIDSKAFITSGESYRVVKNSSTGASVVFIKYLDINYIEKSYFKVMRGTTVVNCPNILRINEFFVCGATSPEAINIGVIGIRNPLDNRFTDQIPVGTGIGSTCAYTVPKDKTAYLTTFDASMRQKTSGGALLGLKLTRFSREGSNGSSLTRLINLSGPGNNHGSLAFMPAIKVPQYTDIIIRVMDVNANNCQVSASLSLLLVKNA